MKVAIFDFDGTLFPVETIPFLIKQYTKLGYPMVRQWSVVIKVMPYLFRYKVLKNMDKEQFRKKAVYIFLELFDGMSETQVRTFFMKNAPVVIELLDKEVVEAHKKCQEEGYHTLLLSGCFDMLLKPVAEYVGFDQVIGTTLLFEWANDAQCAFSSKTPIDVISGERKADAAKKMDSGTKVNWDESIAYADSYYDRNILELVGHKVGVNPDEGLKAICLSEGWEIMITH